MAIFAPARPGFGVVRVSRTHESSAGQVTAGWPSDRAGYASAMPSPVGISK